MDLAKVKLCPICGSTEEDESCLKVHLMMTHKANNPEQLLMALQNSTFDVPKLSAIPKITANSKEATKGEKPSATSGVKNKIAHEGAEGSMVKLEKGNGTGWSTAKLAGKMQEISKKETENQKNKDLKKDHTKPKTCTDSPPIKKGRSCPVVSMARMRSTARPHPSDGHTSTSPAAEPVIKESSSTKVPKPSLPADEAEIVMIIVDKSTTEPEICKDEVMRSLKAHPEALVIKKDLVKKLKAPETVKRPVAVESEPVFLMYRSLNPPHSPDPKDTIVDHGPQFEGTRKVARGSYPKLRVIPGYDLRTIYKKRVDKKPQWSLVKQTDRAMRSCKLWTSSGEPMEVFKKAQVEYMKVPGPCLAGIIFSCYSLKKKTIFQRETGPAQGFDKTRLIEYTLTPFESDVREIIRNERPSENATEDDSVEP